MSIRSLAAMFLCLGCASTPAAVDAGGPRCPLAEPADGEACTVVGAECVYERCASGGVVRAACAAGDGGAGHWSATTTPCGSCNGSACTGNTVCMERQGGALITSCASHGCGTGPLSCDCLCGAGVECTIERYAGTGPIYGCRAGCGASICP